MADVRILLDVYSSDIVSRVMDLTEEISDEEMKDLRQFILNTLTKRGNPEVSETIAWGIRQRYLLWRQTKNRDQLDRKVTKIFCRA